jgi:hypothetical protein
MTWEPSPLLLTHGSPLDIVFGPDGRGALLTNRGTILTTFDNGATWGVSYNLPEDTMGRCLALNNSNGYLFVGCSTGTYASHYVMNISKDKPVEILSHMISSETLNGNGEDIKLQYNDAYYSGSHLIAAFGQANKLGGSLMRLINPEIPHDRTFLRQKRTSITNFYASTICATGGPFLMAGGYEVVSNQKAGIGSYLILTNSTWEWFEPEGYGDIQCCEPEEIARGAGDRCLWMYGTLRRLYLSTLHTGAIRRLIRAELPGDYVAAALSHDGHVWVGSKDGLFRSVETVP